VRLLLERREALDRLGLADAAQLKERRAPRFTEALHLVASRGIGSRTQDFSARFCAGWTAFIRSETMSSAPVCVRHRFRRSAATSAKE